MPKLSVITINYNNSAGLERTIKSVISQSYNYYEYIIIDGGSTDGSADVIKKYADTISYWVSEKDNGIYDAMNKGLDRATGDYVLFLNAGDEFYSSDTLTTIFSLESNADVYYGNTIIVNEKGEQLADRRLTPPEQLSWKSLKYGMCVSHQSFIAKRTVCSPYNLDYSISADIDWVIQVLKRSQKIINTKIYISKFLKGGISNNRRKTALKERFLIMVNHYGVAQTLWNHLFIAFRYPFDKVTRKSMI